MHARMHVGDQVVKGSIGISADLTAKGFEGLVRSLGLRFSSGQSFRKRKQIEAMQNPTARKRNLNDDRVESAKQQEKRKRVEEENERVAATCAAQSPYIDLSVRELREVIYLKTGERTRKQNP